MDEYQAIENIEGFYDYVTNTRIDDDARGKHRTLIL